MKRFFLIPLMAFFSCVMAFATVRTAGTLSELQDALSNAAANDEIQLTADIALPSNHSVYLNITKSITLDGQGHTLSGYGKRGSVQQTIAINYSNSEKISVVLKNLNITTPGLRPIDTRGNLISLELDNVNIVSTATKGNAQGITFSCDAGADASIADLIIKNSSINATASGYPVIIWNPANVIAENSTFAGYCGMYFKNGSFGTVVDAENCQFDAPNVHSGQSNAFAVFAFEDAGIKMNLTNCGMNAEQIGDQSQRLLDIKYSIPLANRTADVVDLTIDGDNSHFNAAWSESYNNPVLNQIIFTPQGKPYIEESIPHVKMTIKGGTYSFNPATIGWYDNWNIVDTNEGKDTLVTYAFANIPEDYEVKTITMEGVANPLYRVVKKAQEKEAGVMYDLNDFVPVEGEDYGNNPVSSFDLSTGTDMTLNQETTTAGYVEVKDNADTSDPTTVTVGTPSQDQTLVINNGLDVQGESQVIVEAGSTLQIGEGGINTEKPANIVITANENGAASLIMDPMITVNQTPNLTVKMKAKQIGWATIAGDKHYFWHRFALPIQECTTWGKYPNKSTYVYGWNYTTNDWEQYSALTQMVPFQGYTLSADYENLGDVEYTFTGQLAGNTNNALEFQRNGYNFFGNSYTGYISILALVDQLTGDNKIDGSVWVWNSETQAYFGVPLKGLRENPEAYEDWQKEIAPMQTFILKQNGSENAATVLNYASAVWGNPRYNNVAAPAPRRAEADETTRMRIVVTAQNGKSDFVMFTEDGKFTDEYENGYDASKYMNEGTLNLFATVNGENYTAVATDNLEGKTLTLNTNDEIAYTISFKKVNGEEYALRDNVTGKVIAIEEGATYEFAAQPNSTVEGRFEIVAAAKMPTAIENTEVKANAKGIYTLTGQYLGEDFEAVPAGVYVVNGVKIVK